MNNIIVIPVYKPQIDYWEELSFRRCCDVFSNRLVCLVSHCECDCNVYVKIAQEYNLSLLRQNFCRKYFEGIRGYNELMLSGAFYKRFRQYDYMLIYQLDAYVFRDELDYWCNKGYDYIGAPWFTDYLSIDQGGNLWCVGNGGLSLRKIATMYKIFGNNRPLLSPTQLWKLKDKNKVGFLRKLGATFVRSLGYKNKIGYFKNNYPENEDVFICQYLKELGIRISIPTPEVAMCFAFENNPSYLFSLTGKLPFACHAWKRYEYDIFWQKYIN